jgi:hypothetical protein
MRKHPHLIPSTLVLAAGLALAGCETIGKVVGEGLTASLSGGQEVPGPGDPDGRGTAELTLVDRTDNLCYELAVRDIEPASAAHIHRGARGVNGPPVVTLDAPTDGESNGCLSVATEIVDAIKANPQGFYINVHTPSFPNGAIRGQLVR